MNYITFILPLYASDLSYIVESAYKDNDVYKTNIISTLNPNPLISKDMFHLINCKHERRKIGFVENCCIILFFYCVF